MRRPKVLTRASLLFTPVSWCGSTGCVVSFRLKNCHFSKAWKDMGPQDGGDQEVFDIVDFTTASEWECFIAAIEEAIHEWRLSGEGQLSPLTRGQLATAKWSERSVVIKFADFPFKMTHHCIVSETVESPREESESSTDLDDEEAEKLPRALEDMMNRENDFPARAHCLVRWYGLREFVTIYPSNPNHPIMSPSKAKLLLSSASIAANNTNCQVPIFVQVLRANEKMYLGVGLGSGVRTDYDMVHFRQPPRQCTHLAGLLDVFKNKLQCCVTSPPVLVSVRFTYVLTEWPHTLWTQQPPDFDATLTEVGFSDLGKLPFGALSDPVSELHLSATWPCVTEDVLVDSDVYSDLDPGSAPLWTARLVTATSPPCLLSEYLMEFLHICKNNQSISQILGPDYTQDVDGEIAQFSSALDRLTEPSVPSLSSVVGRVRMGHKGARQFVGTQSGESSPVPTDILIPILNYLFPDAEGDNPTAPYPFTLSQVPEWVTSEEASDHPLKALLSNMKSSGADGLVWRLAVVLCHVAHSLGGLPAVAHLWHEVVLELRFRWDHAVVIPGVGGGVPDLASTLFHQKLQMLNCCINRRKAREQSSSSKSSNDDADDEDEFYECDEDMEEEEKSNGSRSSWDKPEGRIKRCGKLRLLKTNEPLYIPFTQEPAPMTEDRLEEHAGVLLRLGTDALGSQLRARMMSASLLSDMESFKAANPGAVLEDFVRWYSPRDWVEEVGDPTKPPRGSLSTRMQIPGNMWREVWTNAKPVPARRQKRLFDDTREAEQVLHWLASLGPGTLCCHLLPTITHASLCRLAEEKLLFDLPVPNSLPQPCHSSSLTTVLDVITQRAVRLSRQPPDTNKYQELVEQIAEVEVCVARAQSVRHKILGDAAAAEGSAQHLEELVLRLLDSPEVSLEGGPRGPAALAIRKLFQQARKASLLLDDSPQDEHPGPEHRQPYGNSGMSGAASELGRPMGREYLLRTLVPFPTAFSRPVPHRMFAVLLPNEFRLTGAYSQDTTFS